MSRSHLFNLSLALLVACTGEDKGEPGTEPEDTDALLDSDGDGLSDADEEALGTDPDAVDSDGDTYQDGWEVDAGTDPTDPDSRIYQGYWPYNPDKDSIEDPGMDSLPEAGATFARVVLPDLYGDSLDLYDFAGHGVPTVIELGAGWCTVCQQQASWLDGQPSYVDAYSDEDWYTGLPEALREGRIQWVTILDEDGRNKTADMGTLEDWHDAFPNDAVALMLDADQTVGAYLDSDSYPEMLLLDADMKVAYFWNQTDDLGEVLAELMKTL